MDELDYEEGLAIVRNNYRMRSGLKQRQYDYYINRVSPAEGQEQAFNAIQTVSDRILSGQATNGLLLVGAVGCGKTFMVSSVANNIIDTIEVEKYEVENATEQSAVSGYGFWIVTHESPVQFISVTDLLNQLKACFSDPDAGVQHMIMNRLQRVDLLILDDMGAEKTSDWVCSTLFEIIDYRYNENLPMLVTTNCIPEELKKQIGARNYDRLREMCALVPVTAKSQRQTAAII